MTKETATPSRSPKVATPLEMDFPDAVRKLLKGEKVTRIEWDDTGTYILFVGEFLFIHNSIKCEEPGLHTIQLRFSDMNTKDWIVVETTVIQ